MHFSSWCLKYGAKPTYKATVTSYSKTIEKYLVMEATAATHTSSSPSCSTRGRYSASAATAYLQQNQSGTTTR